MLFTCMNIRSVNFPDCSSNCRGVRAHNIHTHTHTHTAPSHRHLFFTFIFHTIEMRVEFLLEDLGIDSFEN